MWAANYGTVQHTMGFLPGLKAFTAAVFGGIGNLGGAVVCLFRLDQARSATRSPSKPEGRKVSMMMSTTKAKMSE